MSNPEDPAPRACLLMASFLSLGLASTTAGQGYEGWVHVASTEAYDFLIADVPPTQLSADSLDDHIIRITTSRMLVRRVDRERQLRIEQRQRIRATIVGYDAYASTTEVIDVDCRSGRYAVREETDFDRNGGILDRLRFDRDWVTRPERATPMAAIIRWACRVVSH